MDKNTATVGEIVQINPDKEMFGGCLVVVTEVKTWGIQGYISIPKDPSSVEAYIRLKWGEFESTYGNAVWMKGNEGNGQPSKE